MMEGNVKLRDRNKGQVFVIIGIVIALSLVLINIKANFDVALKENSINLDMNEGEILENVNNEYRESYDIAVKKGGSYDQLNKTLTNFTLFMKSSTDRNRFNTLHSLSVYDNGSLTVGVSNFMGRDIEDVEISQNLSGGNYNCGTLQNREGCRYTWNTGDKDLSYTVNVTYTDPSNQATFVKTYSAESGQKGKYTAMFYRMEMDIQETVLTHEDSSMSKPL